MMNKLMNFRKNRKGFTLVEIIVVLVIIAILAAIAIPTMMGFVRDAQDQALIAEARTAYYAAQSIATETAGSALVTGVGTVTYPASGAAWTAAINEYLDSPAAVINVGLAAGHVRPGTVAALSYQKVAGGRVVNLTIAFTDLDGTAQAGETAVVDNGGATVTTSTGTQTVAAGDNVTNS